MDRVRRQEEREGIAWGLSYIPRAIRTQVQGLHFVCELTESYLGLTDRGPLISGRDLNRESHVCWDFAQYLRPAADRVSTIFLLEGDWQYPSVVLHEVGHIIDQRLGFPSMRRNFVPLDDYAATHPLEAFATAFQSWCIIEGPNVAYYHNREFLLEKDPATALWFSALAGETV